MNKIKFILRNVFMKYFEFFENFDRGERYSIEMAKTYLTLEFASVLYVAITTINRIFELKFLTTWNKQKILILLFVLASIGYWLTSIALSKLIRRIDRIDLLENRYGFKHPICNYLTYALSIVAPLGACLLLFM